MDMDKYTIKEIIVWVILLLTLCFSAITAYNSLDNSREYHIVEEVDEIQLQLNNIEQHINYMEIQLEENIYELD